MINVENYMDMVHMITNKRHRQFNHKYEYEDLFQVGCTGLMIAAKRFDDSMGFKFSTYAYEFIDGRILHHIRGDKWYPARTRDERFVADPPISLDAPIPNSDKGKDNNSYLSQLVDDTNNYELSELRIILDKLPDLFKRIIELRYFSDFTQVQVSKILNTNQSQVSKAEKKALQILRKELLVCG